ncbi:hypothetical protein EIP86_005600 [Pleurotus ostreatoroseus]|nr:hypothetical protein EIP86_005600 [Pleurotus ostreatoroseus]
MILLIINILLDFLPQRNFFPQHNFLASIAKRMARLTKRIGNIMRGLPKTTGNNVWLRRELKEISDPGRLSSLDVKALVWVSAAEAAADELNIDRCFEDLSKDLQPRFILEQIALRINKRPGRRLLLVDGTLSEKAVQEITTEFVDEHSALLARALSLLEPEEWYKSKRYHPARKDAPHLLMLAWKFLQPDDTESSKESDASQSQTTRSASSPVNQSISRTQLPSEPLLEAERRRPSAAIDSSPSASGAEDLQRIFLSKLIAVCLAQQFKDDNLENWDGWGTHVCVPAVLLFDVLIPGPSVLVRPPEGDPWRFVEWANNAAQLVNSPDWGQYARKTTITPQELLLSSSAVALHALAVPSDASSQLLVPDPPAPHVGLPVPDLQISPANDSIAAEQKRQLVSLLEHICNFLIAEPYTTRLKKLPRFLRDSETLPFVTPRALGSIRRSLRLLSDTLRSMTETEANHGTDVPLARSLRSLQKVLEEICGEVSSHDADPQRADREADCAQPVSPAAGQDLGDIPTRTRDEDFTDEREIAADARVELYIELEQTNARDEDDLS